MVYFRWWWWWWWWWWCCYHTFIKNIITWYFTNTTVSPYISAPLPSLCLVLGYMVIVVVVKLAEN